MKIALVLGNGPSVNRVPHHLLMDHPYYGVNWCKFTPDYYLCFDEHILRDHADEVLGTAALAGKTYLPVKWKDADFARSLYSLPNIELVDKDTKAFRKEEFISGFTVTYIALKLAYYAGFDEVHLWGVDHTVGWEHYRSDYHPVTSPPDRHAHNLKVMEKHYRLANRVYKEAGRRILNFSNPSPLDDIFERGERV